MGTRSIAAAITPENRPSASFRCDSPTQEPHRHTPHRCGSFPGYSSSSGAFTTSTGTWASRST